MRVVLFSSGICDCAFKIFKLKQMFGDYLLRLQEHPVFVCKKLKCPDLYGKLEDLSRLAEVCLTIGRHLLCVSISV